MLKGNIKLIGISGRARSGKDTLAAALCGQFAYRQHSFAEPIYAMLRTLPYLEYLTSSLTTEEKETKKELYDKSPRQLLQTLGTEWGRNCVHENLWIWLMEEKLSRKRDVLRHEAFVISDLRFPNEADWIRKLGGLVVRVHREQQTSVNPHVSEDGFQMLPEDFNAYNTTTIENLCGYAKAIDDLAEERRTTILSRAAQ